MSDFHCLDIEFPDVDFSQYSYSSTKPKINNVHHAHLYTRKDEIELRILFEEKTNFGDSLMNWTSKIDWRKFGKFIKVELTKNHTNERLQKIDLSEAKMIGATNSSNFYQDSEKYIIVRIDTVKFYWNPIEGRNNTAEFYLSDAGFKVVEPFYSYLLPKSWFKNDGNFSIGRMKDSRKYYKIAKSSFRPEFNFVPKDDRKTKVATITKEPKFQFKYGKGVTENEAIFYGDIILLLASFYHHTQIDYVFRRIYLPQSTITIKNIKNSDFRDTSGGLRSFGINWTFNKFLQSSWQKEALKNFTLLSKAITLFNQSHLVDNYSTFLILYNIIEICDKQKIDNVKFKLTLSKKQVKAKKDEALLNLLETIDKSEHEEFRNRWHNVQTLLQNKPMKNQLVSFLESQNLDTERFPVKLDELKRLRNDITHGSIDRVDAEQLRKANILLYRISGILILNLIGIKDWKLNQEIR